MDHDAMHKDVSRLKKFMSDAEEAVAFYKGMKATGGAIPVTGKMSDDDRNQVIDAVVKQLGGRITDVEGRLKGVEERPEKSQDLSAVEGRLDKLEGVQVDQDREGRISTMLDWFEANREGLELLLSLDGDPDQAADTSGTADTGTAAADTGTQTGASTDTGTAAGAAGSSTGASGDGTSTDGTDGTTKGLPGASQDPSVNAEQATNQPAANPGT